MLSGERVLSKNEDEITFLSTLGQAERREDLGWMSGEVLYYEW